MGEDKKIPKDTSGPGLASQAARLLAGRMNGMIKTVRLDITYPDGVSQVLGDANSASRADLTIHNWKALRRIATDGALGFSEAYMAGEVDSTDLRQFMDAMAQDWPLGDDRLSKAGLWNELKNRLQHALRANSKTGSRKNIAAHYDLGNEFYGLWLDDSMTYSSALFDQPETEELRAAQDAKYKSILDLGQVTADNHVLEIGCGWGGFAEYAAKHRGCNVTGITISQEQYNFAAERIQREGLNEKVELRIQDYRDVEPKGFDRVASIEMFEAVGEQYWPTYFAKVRDVLKDGGRAALQIITIDERAFDDYRRRPDFIQKYIFPGGMLPSPTALRDVTQQSGLTWVEDLGFGHSYAETLMRWNERFQAAWPKIQQLSKANAAPSDRAAFDLTFKRMWEFYLLYCAAGFDNGRIDVKQVVLER